MESQRTPFCRIPPDSDVTMANRTRCPTWPATPSDLLTSSRWRGTGSRSPRSRLPRPPNGRTQAQARSPYEQHDSDCHCDGDDGEKNVPVGLSILSAVTQVIVHWRSLYDWLRHELSKRATLPAGFSGLSDCDKMAGCSGLE